MRRDQRLADDRRRPSRETGGGPLLVAANLGHEDATSLTTVDVDPHLGMPVLVTIEEAAWLLRIGRTTCFGLLRSGALRSVTLGRRRLVPRAELDAFVLRLADEQDHEREHPARTVRGRARRTTSSSLSWDDGGAQWRRSPGG